MGLIYLDAVFCVYALEDAGVKGETARRLISSHQWTFSASPLVEMECLIMPLRLGRFDLEEEYRTFFANLIALPIGREAYDRAARLRATHHTLRTPDALHLAIAQLARCEGVWTADAGFAKVGHPYVRDMFRD